MKIPSALLGLFLFGLGMNGQAAETCASSTAAGEKLVSGNNFSAAQKELEQAVKLCAQDKTARPFVALGKVYYHFHRYPEAIQEFQTALEKEPGLTLAYMDMGACYIDQKQYDKAIEVLKEGVKHPSDNNTAMQINFNLGLAYVKKAAVTNDEADHSGELYFTKSKELDPSYGGNYFYLGLYQEVSYHNLEKAKALYKAGCDHKYPQACQFLASIGSRSAQGARGTTSSGASVSSSDSKIIEQIDAAYKKKGMDEKSTAGVISNLKNACGQMPPGQCTPMLENVLKSVK